MYNLFAFLGRKATFTHSLNMNVSVYDSMTLEVSLYLCRSQNIRTYQCICIRRNVSVNVCIHGCVCLKVSVYVSMFLLMSRCFC